MAPKPDKQGKKKKESAEQRRARLEAEAHAVAGAERERQEEAVRRLRTQAAHEAQLSALNSRRVEAEWVQRMRGAKLEELKEEGAALAQEHRREVDRRERMLEHLLGELRTSGQAHEAAAEAHGQVVGTLLELHGARTGALQGRFEEEMEALQEEFEGERGELQALHHRQRKELQDSIAALQASYAEALGEATAAYKLQEGDLRNDCSEALNVMKLSLEQRVAALEADVEEQHKAFVDGTAEQAVAHDELAASDAVTAAALAQRTARLRGLQQALGAWRGRIVANTGEWERRNAALAGEKSAVLSQHAALKAALSRFRSGQEARLRAMCVNYAKVEGELREQLEVAQRILRAAELCQKHELASDTPLAACSSGSGEEPVQDGRQRQCSSANGSSGPLSNSSGEVYAAAAEAAAEGLLEGGSSNAGCSAVQHAVASPSAGALGLPTEATAGLSEEGRRQVEGLMARINRVVLDGAALEQQRLRLGAENAALRAVLQQVEQGQGVGAEAVEGPLNTLLVVNGRLQRELQLRGHGSLQRDPHRSSGSSIGGRASSA